MSELDRMPAREHDSGEIETFPDGSVSIPVFEERLVVTKRKVVRERIVVRKRTVIEETQVADEVRRQHLEIEADPSVLDVVEEEPPGLQGDAGADGDAFDDWDVAESDLGERQP